jgi:peptidase E
MKIILHGGYSNRNVSDNGSFYKESVKEIEKRDIKVLLVLFAKREEKQDELFNQVSDNFKKIKDKNFQFIKASQDNFIEQVKESDIVYLSGGQTMKLINILKKYPDFISSLKDKVIVGDSAGTYALSTHFYSKTEGGLFEGLGIAPSNVICHYEGVNENKIEELNNDLDNLLLKDYEYKVYYR